MGRVNVVFAGLRPKWYPTVDHRKAETFTPKELEEWNQGKVGPHGADLYMSVHTLDCRMRRNWKYSQQR